VEIVVCGQPFVATSAGPLDAFDNPVSSVVNCEDQAQIDRIWNAFPAGGSAEQFGWLRDPFGFSWRIVPSVLRVMMTDPDRVRARRTADAMMKMVKLDVACVASGIYRNARLSVRYP
jgi:predicted 3-demethylubiquinone-9 3-methyltransferase (glyoxalase superfamily)